MSDAFIIETAGATAGIVVRQDQGFRFYASSRHFFPLEGGLYRRPVDAERAARRFAQGQLAGAAGQLREGARHDLE
jgi:hypothetical protein